MRKREESIDIARGLAIVGIVFGHTLRGIKNAGLFAATDPVFMAVDRGGFMIRLAVFAACAGLMVQTSLSHRTPAAYLRERLVEFTWVYVIWSLLQGLLQWALSSSVNTPPRSLGAVFALWEPSNQMWFLPWIAVMTVFITVTRPWENATRTVLVLSAAAAVSLAMWGWFGPFIFAEGLGLTFFFFAAAAFGLNGYSVTRERLGTTGLVAVMIVGIVGFVMLLTFTDATPPTKTFPVRTELSVILGFLCTWSGLVGVLAGSVLLERTGAFGRMWVYFGKKSMAIFLGHTIAAAAARIILLKLGVESVPVHILVGLVLGVAAPCVLWQMTRERFPYLWSAPDSLRRGTSSSATAAPVRTGV